MMMHFFDFSYPVKKMDIKMQDLGSSFFSIKSNKRYFHRIVFNNKNGKTILLDKFENFQDSFRIDNLEINDYSISKKDIDVLPGIMSLPDDINTKLTYQLVNFDGPKNNILINIKGCLYPIYFFKDEISLHLSTNIFSPTIYGHLSRSIFNKYPKNTSILNTCLSNDFKIVDMKNEIFYTNSFCKNYRQLYDSTIEKTLLQITDACFFIPKFYRNILYTNFIFENINQSQIEMIECNYDEVWSTSDFGVNLIKDKINKKIKIKTLRPGIKTSIYKKENIGKVLIEKTKEEFSEFYNKYKFITICQDTFRSGIDVLLESFFKAFTSNDNAILLIFIEPISSEQVNNKRLRIKYYQNLILNIKDKCNIKKQPSIYLNYGNISQHKKSSLFMLSDCHVLTSRAEGCCMSLIESALCNLPQIVPNHTGLTEIFPDSMTEFIPTIKVNCGHKININGNLEYIGNYPCMGDSPDFNPISFNCDMYDYNEDSKEWIANRMISEYHNKNVEYNKYNTLNLKDKVIEMYNEDMFFKNLIENLPEIKF